VPRRRTFGARLITRAALVLLVAGVLLTALIGRLTDAERMTTPAPSPATSASVAPSAPKSSPSGSDTT
jgi:hypothetical protein